MSLITYLESLSLPNSPLADNYYQGFDSYF